MVYDITRSAICTFEHFISYIMLRPRWTEHRARDMFILSYFIILYTCICIYICIIQSLPLTYITHICIHDSMTPDGIFWESQNIYPGFHRAVCFGKPGLPTHSRCSIWFQSSWNSRCQILPGTHKLFARKPTSVIDLHLCNVQRVYMYVFFSVVIKGCYYTKNWQQ